MSKNAPDFSNSFAMVEEQLAETEQRLLRPKYRKKVQDVESKVESVTDQPAEEQADSKNTQNGAMPAHQFETPFKEIDLVASTNRHSRHQKRRRNLTLKVLESNEADFNRLFHRLQLSGDTRRKQDLADEALLMLFEKYATF